MRLELGLDVSLMLFHIRVLVYWCITCYAEDVIGWFKGFALNWTIVDDSGSASAFHGE
jgi:hypothetical protein